MFVIGVRIRRANALSLVDEGLISQPDVIEKTVPYLRFSFERKRK
jgi:hypothetical protein